MAPRGRRTEGRNGNTVSDSQHIVLKASGSSLVKTSGSSSSETQAHPAEGRSAPGLPDKEFATDQPGVGGFLYCIPVSGPTGGPSATNRETRAAVARCRAASSLPIVVSFGIKTPAAAWPWATSGL